MPWWLLVFKRHRSGFFSPCTGLNAGKDDLSMFNTVHLNECVKSSGQLLSTYQAGHRHGVLLLTKNNVSWFADF
jgi:hypothetical protein